MLKGLFFTHERRMSFSREAKILDKG